jgi:hypothetical protein
MPLHLRLFLVFYCSILTMQAQMVSGSRASPDGNVLLQIRNDAEGNIGYSLYFNNTVVIAPSRTTEVRTARAKHLALYVTLYSTLQMAGDLPENYSKYPDAFQFIADVPVNWQDTRILEAEPGEVVVTARQDKNSDDWYFGGITDEQYRTYTVSLDFLKSDAEYETVSYKDSEQAHCDSNPAAYVIAYWKVTSLDKLDM